MKSLETDLTIVGAGPVGLMCAFLAQLCGIRTIIIDKSDGPLELGRADALNARSLQLFEIVDLFDDLYHLGKQCNTSSVWAHGEFVSRESSWWEALEGCHHKHFLMLGQSHVEKLLVRKLEGSGIFVKRSTTVVDIQVDDHSCYTTLSNGEQIQSHYLIGADGSRSFVRDHFNIPFHVIRPQMIWAVIDGIIETDFPKVPEIITFQSETSDVAWIPREGEIDRFYVRMDTKEFHLDEPIAKINRAMFPHQLRFSEIVWHSQFSVKESVAERFIFRERIVLAGDSCHIHSVNGGQGLNTGLSDAFNLVWKLDRILNYHESNDLLHSYETERQAVAKSVIQTSGELVRSTKYSVTGTHAQDYVNIVKKHAGNITGMGIRYGNNGLSGTRLLDFDIYHGDIKSRIYSLLDYSHFTFLIFEDSEIELRLPENTKIIRIHSNRVNDAYWTDVYPYGNQNIFVRPDAYIGFVAQ